MLQFTIKLKAADSIEADAYAGDAATAAEVALQLCAG